MCSQQTSRASAPTDLESPSLEYAALSELRTELHKTHANLPSHVDEAHVIEDLLTEHEVMNSQLCETSSMVRVALAVKQDPHRYADDIAVNLRKTRHPGSMRPLHDLERIEDEDENKSRLRVNRIWSVRGRVRG